MCYCSKDCVCHLISLDDQKLINERVTELYPAYPKGVLATAKRQEIMYNVYLLRQIDLTKVLSREFTVDAESFIKNYIKFYDLASGNIKPSPWRPDESTSQKVITARILVGIAQVIKAGKANGYTDYNFIVQEYAKGNMTPNSYLGIGSYLVMFDCIIPISAAASAEEALSKAVMRVSNYVYGEALKNLLNDVSAGMKLDLFDGPVEGSDICYCDVTEKTVSDWIDNFIEWLLPFSFLPNLLHAQITTSPVALDLDGDGVESTNPKSSTVYFDFDGDGNRNITGWVGSDDGLLAWDRNGDGVINNGSELFGDSTQLYDGSGTADGAFEALAQEDTNGDSTTGICVQPLVYML